MPHKISAIWEMNLKLHCQDGCIGSHIGCIGVTIFFLNWNLHIFLMFQTMFQFNTVMDSCQLHISSCVDNDFSSSGWGQKIALTSFFSVF